MLLDRVVLETEGWVGSVHESPQNLKKIMLTEVKIEPQNVHCL